MGMSGLCTILTDGESLNQVSLPIIKLYTPDFDCDIDGGSTADIGLPPRLP